MSQSLIPKSYTQRLSQDSVPNTLTTEELGGYSDYLSNTQNVITPPVLGNDSGLLGAALLAHSLPKN